MLISETRYYFNKKGEALNYTAFKLYLDFLCHTHKRNATEVTKYV